MTGELLFFYSDSSKVSNQVERHLLELDFPQDLTFIDIYNESKTAKYWGAMGLPTLILLNQDGNELNRVSGYISLSTLKAFLNLDCDYDNEHTNP